MAELRWMSIAPSRLRTSCLCGSATIVAI